MNPPLTNPVERVPRPKISSGRTRRLEGDEEKRLLDSCTDAFRPIVRLAIETAMRRGEIASLLWKHIDWKKKTAYLPQTKNDEERTVPLSPIAVKILENLGGSKNENIFGVSASYITHTFIKTCEKAGIEGLNFHDLRHEATSRFFEDTDLDIMEIKTITGHKTLQMLARYSHLRTHRLADRLAGAKRGEKPKGKGRASKRVTSA